MEYRDDSRRGPGQTSPRVRIRRHASVEQVREDSSARACEKGAARTRRRPARLLLVLLSSALAFACIRVPPSGAPFRLANAPRPGESLVYVYRMDTLRGAGVMKLSIDGEEIGPLPDRHHVALVIPPGRHTLRLRLYKLNLWPGAWTTTEFEAPDAGTRFIRVWSGYEDFSSRGSPPPTPPGRGEIEARTGVFAGPWPRQKALEELSMTRHISVTGRGQ